MLSRRRLKIGAFLGIFAILLSVVAPTISQTLRGSSPAAAHHAHHAHHVHPAAEAVRPAFAGFAAHHHGSDSSLSSDACPYCGLIAHTPALPGAPVAFSVAAQPAEFAAPVMTAMFRPYAVLTLAQPRAPPALS